MTVGQDITSFYLLDELSIKATKSSGPGGQHVNKVNTRVELKWDVQNSQLLNEEERGLILSKLSAKLTKEGVLLLSEQRKRSQLQNRTGVFEKLDSLLSKAFAKTKPRRPTKPTFSSVKKRLDSKKKQSEKKKWRKGL